MTASDSRTSRSSEEGPYAAGGIGASTLEMLDEARAYHGWIFSQISPYLGRRNLEVGAGQGALSRHVLEHHRAALCEPSTRGRQALEKRFAGHDHLLAVVEDLNALAGDEAFDCIYSTNVLEHVADDAQLLARAAPLLAPGGHFVAVVPAHRWLYSTFDARVGHHRRYDRGDVKRLEQAIEKAGLGLTLVEFRHFNPVGALAWWLRMRVLRKKEISRKDANLMNRLAPWLCKLDRVPIPFGQSLVLCYKKAP